MLAFRNIDLQISGGGDTGLFGHNPPAFHGGMVAAIVWGAVFITATKATRT